MPLYRNLRCGILTPLHSGLSTFLLQCNWINFWFDFAVHCIYQNANTLIRALFTPHKTPNPINGINKPKNWEENKKGEEPTCFLPSISLWENMLQYEFCLFGVKSIVVL